MSVSHTWTEGFYDWYVLSGDPTGAENAALVADYYDGAYLNNYDWGNCRTNGWHLLLTMAAYPGHERSVLPERRADHRRADAGTADAGRRLASPDGSRPLPRHAAAPRRSQLHAGRAGQRTGGVLSRSPRSARGPGDPRRGEAGGQRAVGARVRRLPLHLVSRT